MSRKMKVETPLKQLKDLHGKAMAQVSLLQTELNETTIKLREVENLVAQTSDAIDALEGRPSLKQQLEEALRPRPIVNPKAESTGFTTIPSPNNLPLAEDGFHWAWNNGEWVLVANELWINSENAQEANTAIPLTLPAVMDDEEFTDKPQDFLG